MKKLLNTLYVSTQGIYLRLEGEAILAEKDREILMRLPIHTISGIVCFGNVMCSPFLLGHCAKNGVHVSFLSEHGSFLARVEGPTSGNVLLRLAQVKAYQNPETVLENAKKFVLGKILNTRAVVQRRLRDHGEDEECVAYVRRTANTVKNFQRITDLEQLRGVEGNAANEYFGIFNKLLSDSRREFAINGRNRRPPLDPMNALLSFLYTILAHDCQAALESVGLDPQIGFLHAVRPGRPSLALDLMEEFRPILADRLALSVINLGQMTAKDFKKSESGAVSISDDARKTLLVALQNKKKEIIVHPFLNEKVEIGLLPYVQALLLARHLRGDLDAYPPYLMK